MFGTPQKQSKNPFLSLQRSPKIVKIQDLVQKQKSQDDNERFSPIGSYKFQKFPLQAQVQHDEHYIEHVKIQHDQCPQLSKGMINRIASLVDRQKFSSEFSSTNDSSDEKRLLGSNLKSTSGERFPTPIETRNWDVIAKGQDYSDEEEDKNELDQRKKIDLLPVLNVDQLNVLDYISKKFPTPNEQDDALFEENNDHNHIIHSIKHQEHQEFVSQLEPIVIDDILEDIDEENSICEQDLSINRTTIVNSASFHSDLVPQLGLDDDDDGDEEEQLQRLNEEEPPEEVKLQDVEQNHDNDDVFDNFQANMRVRSASFSANCDLMNLRSQNELFRSGSNDSIHGRRHISDHSEHSEIDQQGSIAQLVPNFQLTRINLLDEMSQQARFLNVSSVHNFDQFQYSDEYHSFEYNIKEGPCKNEFQCPVCICDINVEQIVLELPCNHQLCKECFENLKKHSHRYCPLCRKSICIEL